MKTQGVIRRFAEAFFDDRRLMVLVLLMILVAGLSSFSILPRMEDPVLARRVALVNTRLQGADARRVETLVTQKIEDHLRDIEEIKEIRSVSRVGISSVSIELHDETTETETIWSRVRSRIDDALPNLPAEVSRPTFEQLEVRAYAMILAITWMQSDAPDLKLLRRTAIQLQDQLQNLVGTDLVDRFADPGEEIEIRLDPRRVSALGITPANIAERLASFDAKATAGQLRDAPMQLMIEIENQLDAIEQIGAIPIAGSNGRDVRLDEIATVSVGPPNPAPVAALADGKHAVVLGAMVRPSYRIDKWTAAADQKLSEFKETLPEGVGIDFVLRQSDYVDARLHSLGKNLLMGAVFVTLVICLTMGWRSALLVTLTLPLSSLMVLFGLHVLEIPIHQMSVTGLIIALGLLIDNSIVMVDEVKSRMIDGDSPGSAMAGSVTHLAVPLFGSTLTTALAFAPIALMPGPAGEFVGAISISVILAIFSSLFLALTVIPSVAARVLQVDRNTHQSWTRRGIRIAPLTRFFEILVRICVDRPAFGVMFSIVIPIIGYLMFAFLDEQFFPASGRDQFQITIERPAISSLAATRKTAAKVDAITREMGAKRVDWFFGESAPQFYYNVIANRRGTKNFAQGLVKLPAGIEPLPVIRALQRKFDSQILSSRVLVRQLEQGPPFAAPIEVRVFGPDLDRLRVIGEEVRARLSAMSEVTAVRTDLTEVLPNIKFKVDEAAAVRAGIAPADIARQLDSTLEGSRSGAVHQDNEELPIVVRVGDVDRSDVASIESLDLVLESEKNQNGKSVVTPVHALAKVSVEAESAAIPRMNRMRMNEVAAYLHAGVLPSVVQKRFEEMLDEDPLELPSGYSIEFGGEASKRDDAVGNLFSTVGVLSVLMLATLVLSFGSFRLSAIILCVAFLAVGLGMAALSASGYAFGFMAIIGTMGLIGVAINDSIVVLAAIRANPNAASGDPSAVVSEVMHSSRHVITTTLTTIAGFTPLILDGDGFWPPMAVSIAGGVAGATLLALLLVPALHQYAMKSNAST